MTTSLARLSKPLIYLTLFIAAAFVYLGMDGNSKPQTSKRRPPSAAHSSGHSSSPFLFGDDGGPSFLLQRTTRSESTSEPLSGATNITTNSGDESSSKASPPPPTTTTTVTAVRPSERAPTETQPTTSPNRPIAMVRMNPDRAATSILSPNEGFSNDTVASALMSCLYRTGRKVYFDAQRMTCAPLPDRAPHTVDATRSVLAPQDYTLVPLISTCALRGGGDRQEQETFEDDIDTNDYILANSVTDAAPVEGSTSTSHSAASADDTDDQFVIDVEVRKQQRGLHIAALGSDTTNPHLNVGKQERSFSQSSSNSKPLAPSATHSSIHLREAPSAHSKWLFDEWRLWEGELPCTNRDEIKNLRTPKTGIFAQTSNGRSPDARHPNAPEGTDPAIAPFITRGAHRDYLPSRAYEIENICIDEESGALVEFAAVKKSSDPASTSKEIIGTEIHEHKGRVEHPFNQAYVGVVRWLKPENRETVPLISTPSSPPLTNVPTRTSKSKTSEEDELEVDHGQNNNNKDKSIVGDGHPVDDSNSNWRRVVTASLEAHLKASRPSMSTNGSQPLASVFFVDDSALMLGIISYDFNNPGHMFHRLAGMMSYSRLLGTTSHIFVYDNIGVELWEAYRTLYKINGLDANVEATNKEGAPKAIVPKPFPLELLLPQYLQLNAKNSGQGEEAPKVNVNRDRGHGSSHRAGATGLELSPVHHAIAAMATGQMIGQTTVGTIVHPLAMSGERGCEAMRCGWGAAESNQSTLRSTLADIPSFLMKGEAPPQRQCSLSEVADIRRCGRRHIAVNIALPTPSHTGFKTDTQNTSPEVWNAAVKEAMREAKRIRRDVWAARQANRGQGSPPPPPPSAPAPTAPAHDDPNGHDQVLLNIRLHLKRYDWYMRLWRERLVYLLGLRGGNNPHEAAPFAEMDSRSDTALFEEYFTEYMGYRLEHESLRAQERNLKGRSKTRRLICYRTIYIAQNHFETRGVSASRGSLSQALTPTCHDAEGMKNVYETGAARFGACSAKPKHSTDVSPKPVPKEDEEGGEDLALAVTSPEDVSQLNNTNREAHPVFTLPRASRRLLQEKFGKSRRLIENIVSQVSNMITNKSHIAASSSSSQSHSGDVDAELIDILLSDVSLAALKPYHHGLSSLIDSVGSAQQTYDSVFMKYFEDEKRTRQRGQKRKGDLETTGRPVAMYVATRLSGRRHLHLFRHAVTRLMAEDEQGYSFNSHVGLSIPEGMATERWTSPEYKPTADQNRFPRGDQYYQYMTADIIMGPHGADLHHIAYMKPSGLSLEFSSRGIDHSEADFRAGYFSNIAYARNIGYLRINGHTKDGMSPYLTSPEWRQTFSVAMCAWLASNALRVADDSAAIGNKRRWNTAYLLPWWCRGGPIALLEEARHLWRDLAKKNGLSIRTAASFGPTLPIALDKLAELSFAATRSQRRYGLNIPTCPPLVPTISTYGGADSGKASGDTVSLFVATTVTQQALNRIQTECARMVTRSNAEHTSISGRVWDTEGLQSLIETSLFLSEQRAAALARLVLFGALGAGGRAQGTISRHRFSPQQEPLRAPPLSNRRNPRQQRRFIPPPLPPAAVAVGQPQSPEAAQPAICGHNHDPGDRDCMKRLLRAVLHPHLSQALTSSDSNWLVNISKTDAFRGVSCAFINAVAMVLSRTNQYPLHSTFELLGTRTSTHAQANDQLSTSATTEIQKSESSSPTTTSSDDTSVTIPPVDVNADAHPFHQCEMNNQDASFFEWAPPTPTVVKVQIIDDSIREQLVNDIIDTFFRVPRGGGPGDRAPVDTTDTFGYCSPGTPCSLQRC